MLGSILSWDSLWWMLIFIYVPACFGLIIIVLLQKGKGSGFAGSFGAGAGPGSETVFGPRTGQTLPVKLTYLAAVIFISVSVIMSLVSGKVGRGDAPELLEDAGTAVQVDTGLDSLGIGSGRAGSGGDVPGDADTLETTEDESSDESV